MLMTKENDPDFKSAFNALREFEDKGGFSIDEVEKDLSAQDLIEEARKAREGHGG